MLIRTRAIALTQIRYTDHSTIALVLTETHGKLAIMVRSGKKRSTRKQSYFQPLFLLDVEIEYRENREIQSLKDVRAEHPIHEIASNIRKQTVAVFLAEVLQKSIRLDQPDKPLFEFIYHQILLFDHLSKGSGLFHHYFLAQLMRFLGFNPANTWSNEFPLLDTENGEFVPLNAMNPACLTETESRLVSGFIQTNAEQFPELSLSSENKKLALESLLLYYSKHVPGFNKLKSYDILKAVFEA